MGVESIVTLSELLARATIVTVEHAICLLPPPSVWVISRCLWCRAFAWDWHLLRFWDVLRPSHVRFHFNNPSFRRHGNSTSEFIYLVTFVLISSKSFFISACPASSLSTCLIPFWCTKYAVNSPIMIATSWRCMPVIIVSYFLEKVTAAASSRRTMNKMPIPPPLSVSGGFGVGGFGFG